MHSRDRDIGSWDDAIDDDVMRAPPAYHPLDDPTAHTEGGAAHFFELFLNGEDPASQESHLHEVVQRAGTLPAVNVRDESRVNAV